MAHPSHARSWSGAAWRVAGRGAPVAARLFLAAIALGTSTASAAALRDRAESPEERVGRALAAILSAAPGRPDRLCVVAFPAGDGASPATLGAAECAALRRRFGRDPEARVMTTEEAMRFLVAEEERRRAMAPPAGAVSGPRLRT